MLVFLRFLHALPLKYHFKSILNTVTSIFAVGNLGTCVVYHIISKFDELNKTIETAENGFSYATPR